MKHLILPCIFFAAFFFGIGLTPANASHSVGADLNYVCLGGNQYQFTLNFYRDCAGIAAPTSATVSIASVTCGSNLTLSLTLQSSTEISPLCQQQIGQSTCNGGTLPGIEQYVYSGATTLPQQCTDWVISYSLCCRNGAITNLVSPDAQDLYIQATLNNTVTPCNNSPMFTILPVPYICANQPFFYNHGAIDIDGDILVYSLIDPRTTGNAPIAHTGGLTATQPLNTTGTFGFNTSTGQMSFTPSGVQQAVITVLVEEYRNGVLIGSTMRDMQVIVINCAGNNNPTATGIDGTNNFSVTICAGFPLCFDVFSNDIDLGQNTVLIYNSGIPNGIFNVTGSQYQQAEFCWQPTSLDIGSHNFSVTVRDDACPILGSNTYNFTIIVQSNPHPPLTVTPDVDLCGNACANLSATGSGNIIGWQWNPPTGLSNPNIPNPQACPSQTTTYTVSAFYGDSCVAAEQVTVSVEPGVTAVAGPNSTICTGGSVQISGNVSTSGGSQQTFSNTVNYPITDYDVLFGATITRSPINVSGLSFSNITTSSIQSVCVNINHTYDGDLEIFLEAPNGTAMFLSNRNGAGGDNYTNTCFTSTGSPITAGTPPFSGNFSPQVPFTNLNGVPANGIWNLAVIDQASFDVGTILDWSITLGSTNAITGYSWSPTTGLSNPNILNPVATPTVTTTYILTGTNTLGCAGSASVTIIVGGLTLTTAAVPTACGQSNGTAISSVNGGTPPITYLWNNGATSSVVGGLAAGTYTVTATDAAGCFGVSNVVVPVSSTATGPPGLWTWTGTMSVDWFDPCNWDKLVVPTAADPVLIPGATANNPWVNGNTAFCQSRTINHSNGGHITILRSTGGKMIVGP